MYESPSRPQPPQVELSPVAEGIYAELQPQYRPTATRAMVILLFVVYALQVTVLDLSRWILLGAAVQEGEWYRIVSGALLHAPPASGFGVFHLLMNAYFGWMIGSRIERQIGALRMIVLSAVSMVGAGLLVTFVNPWEPTVGFSGVLYGWLGSWLAFHFTSRFPGLKLRGRQMRSYLEMLGINLVISFAVASISWTGHLGGLIAGFLVALLLGMGGRRDGARRSVEGWS